MYRVESIGIHPKDSKQFEITVQDEEGNSSAFPVHEDMIIKFTLRKGLELSNEELKLIQREADLWKVYLQAIHYLSYRMRTRQELKRYLLKKEFYATAVDYTLDRLEQEKHLDDAEFANAFVRTRMRLSTKGPQLVARELNELGVNKNVIQDALEQYTWEKQLENAGNYLSKKLGSSSSTRSQREEKDRAHRLLMTRGFSHDINKEVLDQLTDATTEEEWEAVKYQGEKALRKYAKLDKRAAYQKTKQYLYRKGFTGELIQRFIDESDDAF